MLGGLDARGVTPSPWPAPTGRAADAPPPHAAARRTGRLSGVDPVFAAGCAALATALTLWTSALPHAELGALDGLGIVSAFPWMFPVAVAVLTISFAALTTAPSSPGRHAVALGHVVAFAGMLHATPAIAMERLGHPWAGANASVGNSLASDGTLPSATVPLAAPDEWPGVHAFVGLLADVAGVDAASIARWFPVASVAVTLLALTLLYSALAIGRRVTAMALWLFVAGAWVGQEQLGPLGLALPLTVALFALALPLDRYAGKDALITASPGPTSDRPLALAAAVCTVVAVAGAIVATHPVVPLVLAAVFAFAGATRASHTVWLAVTTLVLAAGWYAGPGWSLWQGDVQALFSIELAPAEVPLWAGASLEGSTAVVVVAGRFVAQALLVLAVLGLALRMMHGRPHRFLAAAAIAPALFLVGGFDAAHVLQAYLFALPWLALLSALALAELATSRYDVAARFAQVAVLVVLTAGALAAYSGERAALHQLDVAAATATTDPGDPDD